MTFFPAGFDPRSDPFYALDLVSIDTVDGVFRFLLGVDGIFTDTSGNQWLGAKLISGSDMRVSTQGEAPSGTLTLSFIQDPDEPDLISEVRALGTDYVKDREIIFWVQALASVDEFFAPVVAPTRFLTRSGSHIEFQVEGHAQRSNTLHFEGPFTGRNTAPGFQYTVADHARLIGEANASLRLMPTDTFQEQKLFG
jgi:hypothetical protein